MSIIAELKRRNVIRVAVAYLVASWLLIEVSSVVLPTFHSPEWVLQALMMLVMIGFPIALFVSWVFEITPEGLKRESEIIRDESITHLTGKRMDVMTMVLVLAGVGFVILDRTVWDSADSPAVPAPVQAPPNASATQASADNTTAKADTRASVAVLPFVNMSGNVDDEYFSDGITEEILNVLAKIKDLKVAARTSTFLYKGKQASIGEVANALGVAYVLEGSVRRSGETVRITAQLINAADGFHLWSDTYDRQLTDIFAIQDEISTAIAEALQVTLEVGNKGANTSSVAAYDLYLLGRHHFHQRSKESLERAREYFEQAVAVDPGFAPAFVGIADSVQLLLKSPSSYGDLGWEEVSRVANENLSRALELDPDLAEAYASRGLLLLQDNDFQASLEQLDHSIALNPNYSMAYMWRGLALAGLGRPQRYRQSTSMAAEIDPMSPVVNTNMAFAELFLGHFEEGMNWAEKSIDIAPDFGSGHNAIGAQFWVRGELVAALHNYRKAHQLAPSSEAPTQNLGWTYLDLGQAELAETVMMGRLRADFLFSIGRYAEAFELETQAQLHFPGIARQWLRMSAAVALGDYDTATAIFEQHDGVAGYNGDAILFNTFGSGFFGSIPGASLVLAYLELDRPEQASTIATRCLEFLDRLTDNGAVAPGMHVARASLLAVAGDVDQAMALLEQAVDEGWRSAWALQADPALDSLEDREDFRALVARIEADTGRQWEIINSTVGGLQ